MVVAAPHLRADAQRNLERILEAARETFAEQGLEASVADIAQRAGVGTATIFRRFPTKPSLVAAIITGELTTMLTLARTAAESADPGQALGPSSCWVIQRAPLSRTAASAKRPGRRSSSFRDYAS